MSEEAPDQHAIGRNTTVAQDTMDLIDEIVAQFSIDDEGQLWDQKQKMTYSIAEKVCALRRRLSVQ